LSDISQITKVVKVYGPGAGLSTLSSENLEGMSMLKFPLAVLVLLAIVAFSDVVKCEVETVSSVDEFEEKLV
jgi:hypothetical protein